MVEVETVAIFRDLLRKNKFYNNKVIVEEQISNNPRIKKLLQNASKSGPGSGRPEFIIQHKELDDFLIVVECKDDIKKHESKNRDKFKDYAVDGALLYSQYLSKEYDVLSIAISGNKKNLLRKSFFLQLKGEEYKDFELKDLDEIEDLIELYLKSNEKKKTQHENILKFSIHLNTFLHKNKIQEKQRALLFSGILVALKNRPFSISYKKHKNPKSLTNALLAAIYEEFSQSDVFENYKDVIKNNFAFIKTHKTLTTSKDFLITMISEIDKSINKYDPDASFVEVIDFISHNKVPEYLSKSNIFIFASSCENMPITLIEGMASGLPIACSDRGPMPEVLQDGGVYFNPEDCKSIVFAVEKIIYNHSLRKYISKRAKKLSNKYSWKIYDNIRTSSKFKRTNN